MSALAGVGRRRRVIAGEGMMAPVKLVEFKEDGRYERLLPGRSRIAPDHWIVRQRPERFKPADPRDTLTARHHRELLERTERALRRDIGSEGATALRPRLGSATPPPCLSSTMTAGAPKLP